MAAMALSKKPINVQGLKQLHKLNANKMVTIASASMMTRQAK